MNQGKLKKGIFVVGVLIVAGLIWYNIPKGLDAQELIKLIRSHRTISPLIAFGMAVVQAAIPIFPFFMLSSANGIVFGPVLGIILTWLGALSGATLTFGLARYLGEEWVLRFIDKKYLSWRKNLNWQAILVARLIPVIPSTGVNLVAGLSQVSLFAFVTASAVGKLPFAIVYTILGYSLLKANQVVYMVVIVVLLVVITYLLSTRRS